LPKPVWTTVGQVTASCMVTSNMKPCNSNMCVKITVRNVVLTCCVWFFWFSWS